MEVEGGAGGCGEGACGQGGCALGPRGEGGQVASLQAGVGEGVDGGGDVLGPGGGVVVYGGAQRGGVAGVADVGGRSKAGGGGRDVGLLAVVGAEEVGGDGQGPGGRPGEGAGRLSGVARAGRLLGAQGGQDVRPGGEQFLGQDGRPVPGAQPRLGPAQGGVGGAGGKVSAEGLGGGCGAEEDGQGGVQARGELGRAVGAGVGHQAGALGVGGGRQALDQGQGVLPPLPGFLRRGGEGRGGGGGGEVVGQQAVGQAWIRGSDAAGDLGGALGPRDAGGGVVGGDVEDGAGQARAEADAGGGDHPWVDVGVEHVDQGPVCARQVAHQQDRSDGAQQGGERVRGAGGRVRTGGSQVRGGGGHGGHEAGGLVVGQAGPGVGSGEVGRRVGAVASLGGVGDLDQGGQAGVVLVVGGVDGGGEQRLDRASPVGFPLGDRHGAGPLRGQGRHGVVGAAARLELGRRQGADLGSQVDARAGGQAQQAGPGERAGLGDGTNAGGEPAARLGGVGGGEVVEVGEGRPGAIGSRVGHQQVLVEDVEPAGGQRLFEEVVEGARVRQGGQGPGIGGGRVRAAQQLQNHVPAGD